MSNLRLLRRPRRLTTGLLALSLLFVAAGCAPKEPDNPFRPGAMEATEIRVRIENQGFNDARVYAVSVGGMQLLGGVPGKATRTYTLDWRRLDGLQLRMDFLAGDTFNSNTVDVAPGDQVELIIPIDPRGAFLRRR